jgi:glycerophosphoryl diester phosphodiesterase
MRHIITLVLAAGVPFIEIDVATARDGVLVLMHDDTLDDAFLADGNPSEYLGLVRSGGVMIASDSAVAAQRAIGFGSRACRPAGSASPHPAAR